MIVYFEGFENSRLKELADLYPEHAKWINEAIDRVVDIHKPFKEFYYYDPKQKGSTSIKKVLPALTDVSYKHLAIQNGQEAAIQFLKLVNGKKNEKIRESLHKYCELDTKAMVDILEKLKELF